MNNNNGSIWYALFLDNSKFRQGANEAKQTINSIGDKMQQEANKIDNAYNKISNSLKFALSTSAVAMFANSIAKVRGEFQQLEISINTMLGNKTKADTLISQMVETAAKTPFGLKEVSQGAKQLLAYSVEAEKVNETLLKLGDIAAGMAIPLSDIVYLYGTTINQGKMNLVDYKQFLGRGIPIAEALAEQFKIAKGEVAEFVSAGKVGAEEFNKAIDSMAKDKFNNLMAEQSKSITGQISNLKDKFDLLLNDLGKSSEGVFSSAISGATYLIENYKEIGKTIAELVAVYGTYKAVLISISAVQKLNSMILRQAVLEKYLAAKANVTLSNSEAIAAAKTRLLTIAKMQLTQVTRMLNATMLANPYVLVAAAVAGLSYGIYKLATHQTQAEKAQQKLNDTFDEFQKNAQAEIGTVDTLFAQLKALEKGTEAYEKIKKQIIDTYPQYLQGLSAEIQSLKDIDGAYAAIIGKLEEKYRLEAYQKGISDANKDFADFAFEKENEIEKILTEKLGNKRGEEVFFKIKPIIDGEKAIEELNQYGEIWKELQEKAGIFEGNLPNQIKKNILKIKDARRVKEDIEQRAFEKIQHINQSNQEDKTTENTPKTAKTLSQLLKEQKDNVQKITEIRQKLKNDVENKDLNKALEIELENQKNINEKIQQLTGEKGTSRTDKKEKTFDTEAFELEQQRKATDQKLAEQKRLIDAMEEGYQKERALIAFHHKEKAEAIDRALEDEIQKLQKQLKEKNINTRQYEEALHIANEIYTSNHAINNDLKQRQENNLLKDLLKEYQDYETQRTAILEEFARKRRAIEIELSKEISEEKRNELEKALKILGQKENESLLQLETQSSGANTAIAKLFGDMSKKSLQDLKEIQHEAEAAFETLKQGGNLSAESLKSIEDKLKSNKELIRSLSPIFKQLKVDFQTLGNKNASLEDKERAFDAISGNIQKSTQALAMFGDVLKSLGNDGLSQLSGMISQIGGQAMQFSSILKNFGVGGMTSFGIGAGIGILTSTIQFFASARERQRAQAEYERQRQIEHEKRLNDLLHQRLLKMEQYSNAFVSNKMGRHIEQLNTYKTKISELAQKARELENVDVWDRTERVKKWFPKIHTIYTEYDEHYYKPFKDKIGRLVDDIGNLNHDLLEKLDPNDKEYANFIHFNGFDRPNLKEGSATFVKDLQEFQKKAQEIKAELEKYVEESFGALGNGFADSIVSAVEKGTNAFDTFGDTVSSVMKNLLKQMLVTDKIKAMFDTFNKDIATIYAKNMGVDNAIVFEQVKNHTLKFVNGVLKPEIEKGEAITKHLFDELEKEGIKMYDENATGQGKAKGFAAMSQDTANELNARFTLMTELQRIGNEELKKMLSIGQSIKETTDFMKDFSSKGLLHLANIEANTFILHQVGRDITTLKNAFADIQLHGIKIK